MKPYLKSHPGNHVSEFDWGTGEPQEDLREAENHLVQRKVKWNLLPRVRMKLKCKMQRELKREMQRKK